MVHFDMYYASKIAKLNMFEFQKHNSDSMARQCKIPPSDTLAVGQRVKILVQRSIFRKHMPLKQSIWSEDIFHITHIDKSKYPLVYYLSNHTKKFYDFELQALPDLYPLNDNNPTQKNTILVDSFHLPERPYLRSGRSKANPQEPIYSIMKEGKISSVTKKDLEHFKKTFGNGYLVYSSFFSDPNNSKYIV